MSKNLVLSLVGLLGVGLLALGCGANMDSTAQEESVGTQESALGTDSCWSTVKCIGVTHYDADVNSSSQPMIQVNGQSTTVQPGTTRPACFYTHKPLLGCSSFNFEGTRRLSLNGVQEPQTGACSTPLPPVKTDGGYCFYMNAGPSQYAGFSFWY
jgi:hypothetical protein